MTGQSNLAYVILGRYSNIYCYGTHTVIKTHGSELRVAGLHDKPVSYLQVEIY